MKMSTQTSSDAHVAREVKDDASPPSPSVSHVSPLGASPCVSPLVLVRASPRYFVPSRTSASISSHPLVLVPANGDSPFVSRSKTPDKQHKTSSPLKDSDTESKYDSALVASPDDSALVASPVPESEALVTLLRKFTTYGAFIFTPEFVALEDSDKVKYLAWVETHKGLQLQHSDWLAFHAPDRILQLMYCIEQLFEPSDRQSTQVMRKTQKKLQADIMEWYGRSSTIAESNGTYYPGAKELSDASWEMSQRTFNYILGLEANADNQREIVEMFGQNVGPLQIELLTLFSNFYRHTDAISY
jgi:hypothetical protein